MDEGTECTLSKFVADTELREVSALPEASVAVQQELDRPECWVERILMKFHEGRCRVLHLWKNDPLNQPRGLGCWEAALWRGTRELWCTTSYPWASLCALMAKEASGIWENMRSSIASRSREVILPLFCPTLDEQGLIPGAVSSSALSSSIKARKYWKSLVEGCGGDEGDWTISYEERLFSQEKRKQDFINAQK